jgi:ribonuclease HI
MLVTLNCDGSIDFGAMKGNPKKAGWAYWISSDVGKFKSYGRCPDCTNTMAPELAAIAKGIHFIRNHEKLSKATKIIINTDCVPAINWVATFNRIPRKSDKQHNGTLQNIARFHIVQMVKEGYNGLPEVLTEYRHVKAHTGELSASRTWVNNWLDEKAKEGRFLKLNR